MNPISSERRDGTARRAGRRDKCGHGEAAQGVYQPDRGHFVFLSFSSHAGREQAGRRPALVLPPLAYNIATGAMLACPVTSQLKGGSFEVVIPRGARLAGAVLSDHLRSVDWIARNTELHSIAPPETVLEVLARIEAILRISLDP